MSFDLVQVHKLKATGGPTWDEYCRLVAAADGAAHGSPAHEELGRFQQQWEQNPQAVIPVAEARAKARAKAS
jgi:hypothetical protein